jgi:hypothetical protein
MVILKGQFFSRKTIGLGLEYRFVLSDIFDYENSKLSILIYCHGIGKINYGCLFARLCFNGFYKKVETLVF